MNRLQNNFTTAEQSKRLLELGVPEWTADCFRWNFSSAFGVSEDNRYSTSISVLCYEYQRDFYDKLPCWSVGRLIEILEIILGSPWSDKELLGKQGTLLERVVSDFEDVVKYKEIFKDNRIDFSKFEE